MDTEARKPQKINKTDKHTHKKTNDAPDAEHTGGPCVGGCLDGGGEGVDEEGAVDGLHLNDC
jgi:hypothetical protein